ncbi:NAD(P)H-binding protein [Actinoallomurus acaciae]|uniref:NAD(P)H-binding protein n=1 Tax=Actinoallomurus acaciae TaxID=502577 RepID=A0ABV5Y9A9_9ACTN
MSIILHKTRDFYVVAATYLIVMILVAGTTGLTGLIGTVIIREFARQNVPLRAPFRNPEKARHFDGLDGAELAQGDMLRPKTLTAASDGVDRVLLISSRRTHGGDAPHINRRLQGGRRDPRREAVRKGIRVGFDPKRFRGTPEHVDAALTSKIRGNPLRPPRQPSMRSTHS